MTHVPFDVIQYKVEEKKTDGTSCAEVSGYHLETTNEQSSYASIASTSEATKNPTVNIVNTYTQLRSLDLEKTFATGTDTDTYGGTEFTYDVTLVTPNGITLKSGDITAC